MIAHIVRPTKKPKTRMIVTAPLLLLPLSVCAMVCPFLSYEKTLVSVRRILHPRFR